jgi:hypothetical protein
LVGLVVLDCAVLKNPQWGRGSVPGPQKGGVSRLGFHGGGVSDGHQLGSEVILEQENHSGFLRGICGEAGQVLILGGKACMGWKPWGPDFGSSWTEGLGY